MHGNLDTLASSFDEYRLLKFLKKSTAILAFTLLDYSRKPHLTATPRKKLIDVIRDVDFFKTAGPSTGWPKFGMILDPLYLIVDRWNFRVGGFRCWGYWRRSRDGFGLWRRFLGGFSNGGGLTKGESGKLVAVFVTLSLCDWGRCRRRSRVRRDRFCHFLILYSAGQCLQSVDY